MTVGSDYADDLKQELLAEMADNFFSRRHRLDERLENFTGLKEKVAQRGAKALARWRAFRDLLLHGERADRLLTTLGFDPVALAAFPDNGVPRPRLRQPLALTAAGRYRRAVLAAYEDLRRDLVAYNEGGYAPDPHDPRRMGRLPGYAHLLETARGLNEEITAINASQCPSDILQFTKTLDPSRQEREYTCGGIGDACRLDNSLAYTCLDLDHLGAPCLPPPPPLENVRDLLADTADALYAADPAAAKAALAK